MSTIDLTQSPSMLTMRLAGGTAIFTSGLIGSTTTLDRGGFHWEAIYTYMNLHHVKRAELMGIIAKLRAQANRLRIPVWDNPKRGAYGGTPLVDGASQEGSDIDVNGVGTVSDWIMLGDYFGITVNGEVELKLCTADASSSGGDINIEFEPRLRASPANGAAIIVDDGALGAPTGVFIPREPTQGWSSRPFQSGSELSSITLSMVEDYFASQA